MRPEQIINKFRAGNYWITVGITDDGRNAMRLEQRQSGNGGTWVFDSYAAALAVAEWLRGLSDDQRDVVILEG